LGEGTNDRGNAICLQLNKNKDLLHRSL
jgi:hypothetical protein